MLDNEFNTTPGITHSKLVAVTMKIGAITLIAVPTIITFFLPILSDMIPPGSWKRMLLVFWIVAIKPTIDAGVCKTLMRYRLHQRFHRLLKML